MDEVRRTDDRSRVHPQWYLDAFGADYLEIYGSRSGEQAVAEVSAVMRRWDLERGARVLDLCCGAGRHLEPIASYPVTAVGLDRSASLLEQARARFRAAGRVSPIVQGDMRRLPFGRAFDAVAMFFTSFGYFFDEHDNQRVLREVARVLRPGGRAMLDLMDKRFVMESLVRESSRSEHGRTIREQRWISDDERRVEKEISVSGEGRAPRRFTESVRLYEPDEITAMFVAAGFEPPAFTGSVDGDEFRAGTGPRMVVWGREERAA